MTLPCEYIFSSATMREPVPRFKPVGYCVFCEVWAPTWRLFWYSRSSNIARSLLKPVVLTFARLLEMTVMRVCCASSPVFAAHSAGFIVLTPQINQTILHRPTHLGHRDVPRRHRRRRRAK